MTEPTVSPESRALPQPSLWLNLGSLLEHAWVAATCFIVAIFLTGAYVQRAPRIYAATAVLHVEQMEHRVMKIENVQQEDLRWPDIPRTIEQSITSRPVLEKVVEANRLTADPRFADPKTGRPATRDELVNMLARIAKPQLRRGTRLIDLTVAHTIPDFAAQMANAILREYIRQSVAQQATSTQVANEFLMEEAQRLRRKLQESEKALQEYREKTRSVSLEERQNIVVQRLRELSLKVTEAKSLRLRVEAEWAQVDKVGTNVEALLALPSVVNDQAVAGTRLQLSKLEADFANLQQRYKEKHPKYIQAASELAEWRRSLAVAVAKVPRTLRIAYDAAKASEQALEQALREQEAAALELNQQEIQYKVLEREMQSDRTLYEAVLQRMNETAVAKNLEPNKLRVIESAQTPSRPVSPRVGVVLVLGAFTGLLVGVGLALLLGFLDSSLKTVDQAEEWLGLPVLSVVPNLRRLKPGRSELIVSEASKSAGAEAFRSLRTSLSMLGPAEQRRVFLITSALPQEGKTFCSVNYAACLAQSGRPTVLIDGDLRRPAVADVLAADKGMRHPGVTDFLTAKAGLKEIVQPTKVDKFHYISAGTTAPNPAELLAQGGFDGLIDEALQHFECVVVDSAPIQAVSDTLLILKRVQTVCLVVRAAKTARRAVLRAAQTLQQAKAPLGGTILNRMARRRGLNYYYDHYYYDYSYRGKYASKGVYGEK